MPEALVVENFLAMSRETTAWVKCVSYRIRGRALRLITKLALIP